MARSKKKKKKLNNNAVSYPLRVACVDMGSNAIRFLAAEFGEEGKYGTLVSERCPVRLGHSVSLRFLGEEQPIEVG